MSNQLNIIQLPLYLKLDSQYFGYEPQLEPLVNITLDNKVVPHQIVLPVNNEVGVLKNDGTGKLIWGSTDINDNILNVFYNGTDNTPLLNLMQQGIGYDAAIHFHTPASIYGPEQDYTMGIDVTDSGVFKISNSTELGFGDIFKFDDSGIFYNNIFLPNGDKFGIYGVIEIGASAHIYNITIDRNIFYGLTSGNVTYSSAMDNTSLGSNVMSSIFDGVQNVAIGSDTFNNAVDASNTISIGFQALRLVTSGDYNCAIGTNALTGITTQSYNTAVGGRSLETLVTGQNATAIGYRSGMGGATGSHNTYIGYQSGASGTTLFNSTAIGANSQFNKSNKIQLGDTGVAFLGLAGAELTLAEFTQLTNINAATISPTQWGYLSTLNQALRTTSDVTFHTVTTTAGISTFGGNVTINGDLTVNGSEVIIDTIYHVDDPMLVLNVAMPPGPGVLPPGFSGIEINRGTLTNYRIVYDESVSTVQIGLIGALQPVACREPVPVDGAIPVWSAAANAFVTIGSGLTPAEIAQLQNIDDNVISYDAWKYVGYSSYQVGNFGTGSGARNSALGTGNVWFGDNALANSNLVAITDCIAIGSGALAGIDNVTGVRNIGIGTDAGSSVLDAPDNIFIGYHSGSSTLLGKNICIGNTSNTMSDTTQSVIIGNNAACTATGGSNCVIIGESASIDHINAARSIVIGRNSHVAAGIGADVSDTIILGSGISVVPTGPKQIYTYTGLGSGTGDFLVYASTGQIGTYNGLTTDIDGFIINSDLWITNHTMYLGEKLPVADYGHGLSYTANFGGVATDGAVLFGYTGGLLGSTNVADRVTLKWDDSQAATFYGNCELPYANVGGTAGVLSFGFGGPRMFAPAAAASSLYCGVGAGRLASTGMDNIGFGSNSLAALTNGANNTCYGYQTGMSINTAIGNTFIGSGAGELTTSGSNLVAVGFDALGTNDTGYDNIAIGHAALSTTVVGHENVAVGSRALLVSTNHTNTAVGFESGVATSTGAGNTFLGYQAGSNNNAGSNNTAIGILTAVGVAGSRRTAIGYGSSVTADDTMVLGDDNVKVIIRQAGLAAGNALTVTGNIACTGNVDGVDISLFKSTFDGYVNQDVRYGSDPNFDNMTSMVMSGFKAWAGVGPYYTLLPANVFRLDVGGTGYSQSTLVTFTAPQSITYIPNAANYIYIDSAGLLNVTSSGSGIYDANIVLFELLYDGTATPLIKKENHPYKFETAVSTFLHNNLGTIIRGVGAIVSIIPGTNDGTSATDIQVKMVGQDVVEDHGLASTIPDSAGAAITIQYWYLDLVLLSPTYGKWIMRVSSTSAPLEYNSGAFGILPLTAGFSGVMRVYVVADNLNVTTPTYIAVMNTAEYANLAAAEAGINAGSVPSPTNELLSMEPCQLGYIIINNTGAFGFVEEVIVQKNTFNSRFVGGAGGSSHLVLSDLNGGQYGDGGHTAMVTSNIVAGVPTITDDIDLYKKSSMWISTTPPGGDSYICTDNANGAAVWKRVAWSNLNEIAIGPSSSSTTYSIAIGASAKSINNGVSIGYQAGMNLTSSTKQVAIGYTAGNTVQSGSNGVFIGTDSDGTTAGAAQIAIGNVALVREDYGIAIGSEAAAGGDCISIGQRAAFYSNVATPPYGAICIGYWSGALYSTGSNICIGYFSGYNNTADLQVTAGCTIIGESAGYYLTGNDNTLIGKYAARATDYQITTGTLNVCVGYNSGVGNTDSSSIAIGPNTYTRRGNNNIAIGAGTMSDPNAVGTSTGSIAMGYSTSCRSKYGVAIGYSTLTGTGDANVCIGRNVMGGNNSITGANNVSFGRSSMYYARAANSSICLGYHTGYYMLDSTGTVAIGHETLRGTSQAFGMSGNYNTAIGYQSMQNDVALAIITAAENTAIGYRTLYTCADGQQNTAIGYRAGDSITSGSTNVCIGANSDGAATVANQIAIGNTAVCAGAGGISIGANAKSYLEGVSVGYNAANSNVAGSRVTCVGVNAGRYLNGNDNCAVGYNAMLGNIANLVTGTSNCAFGNYALYFGDASVHSGGGNCAFGGASLMQLTTGSYNHAFGTNAGLTITTGSNNIYVGRNADTAAATIDYQIGIGFTALTGAVGAISLGSWAKASNQYSIAIGSGLASSATSANVTANYGIAMGYSAACSGANGIAIGNGAACTLLDTVAIGTGAKTVDYGVSVGYHANNPANAAALYCTAIGYNALAVNTSSSNTAIGAFCMQNCVASCPYNTGMGTFSMSNVITTDRCSIYGYSALANATGVTGSCAFGYQSLTGANGANIITGSYNTAMGFQAMLCSAATPHSCAYNSAFGYLAGTALTTGGSNCIFGTQAGMALTTGGSNSIFGPQAGVLLTTGSNNVFMGNNAGDTFVTGDNNVCIGLNADGADATNNQTAIGVSAVCSAKGSTAIGVFTTASGGASVAIGGGSANAVGSGALATALYSIGIGGGATLNSGAQSTGVDGIAIGRASRAFTGTVSIGPGACGANATGTYNTAVGYTALSGGATTGANNCGFGIRTLNALIGGGYNIALGTDAGDTITDGNENICIGHLSDADATSSHQIAIGNSAIVTGTYGIAIGRNLTAAANQVAIGGTDITTYKHNGFNTYITPTALQSIYTVAGSVYAGFTITFPANVTPWHVKITMTVWDDTDAAGRLLPASTAFEATGGNGSGAAGGTIVIGSITQCGSINGQFDTIVGTSATVITVTKTANYIAGATRTMKLKFYADMHFGTIVSVAGLNASGTSITF